MDDDIDNRFPRFRDGDVAIHLSLTEQYQLHSQVLKQNSVFFEEELAEPGAKLTAKARRDGSAAYRFDLVGDPANAVGRLQRRVHTSALAPPSPLRLACTSLPS